MPGQTLSLEACVLDRRPASDAFQGFLLFSPEHGCVRVQSRVSRRPGPQGSPPDLFDEVSALLESSNQGRSWFAKELRVVRRRPGIGRSYEALSRASALTGLLARNNVHEESRAGAAELLRTALDSLDGGARPEVVYLKSLYVFARDEGYPVRQEWMPSLGEADGPLAAKCLSLPLGRQVIARADAERLARALESYLASSTDIVIP